jgi:glycosyltransferase involved in cell wall biosynthesis
MSRPSFSVVTPSLNQGRFVGAAIESVLAQDVPDVEHIVVDGGSTDETHNVLARYPHLIVLRDEGRGQSQAVNLGFRAASGDVIGWVNADDCYVPGAFDGARRAFAKHPDAGFVYGNAEYIDETGAVVDEVRAGPFDLQRLLNGVNTIPQPSVFMRASVLERVGLLDERLHYVMDYELWLRTSRVSRLVWVDETWAQFRQHGESKTVGQFASFWPEARSVSRAYGGPFFSEAWRRRTLSRTFPKVVLDSLRARVLRR